MKALCSSPTTDSPPKYTLTLTDRPIPTPAPNEVIVKVLATGINPSDGGNALANIFRSKKPIIPGRDFAGIVHESRSPSFPTGAPVFGTSGNVLSFTTDGAAAEYVAVSGDALASKPNSLSFAQAGAVGVPYTTALEALEKGRVAKGKDTVLILGASGSVGRAAASICRAWRCRVITASRRDSTDVNLTTDPRLERVKEILGGDLSNVIIDAVGSAELMESGMRVLAWGGRYVLLSAGKGGGGGREAKLDMLSLYRQAHSVIGINSIEHSPQEMARSLARLAVMFDTEEPEGPDERKLIKIDIEEGPRAYAEAFRFTGSKYVIVFDEQ